MAALEVYEFDEDEELVDTLEELLIGRMVRCSKMHFQAVMKVFKIKVKNSL